MISREVLEQALKERYQTLQAELGDKERELRREDELIRTSMSYRAPAPYRPLDDLYHYERGYREIRAELTEVAAVASLLEERTSLPLRIGRATEGLRQGVIETSVPPTTTRQGP